MLGKSIVHKVNNDDNNDSFYQSKYSLIIRYTTPLSIEYVFVYVLCIISPEYRNMKVPWNHVEFRYRSDEQGHESNSCCNIFGPRSFHNLNQKSCARKTCAKCLDENVRMLQNPCKAPHCHTWLEKQRKLIQVFDGQWMPQLQSTCCLWRDAADDTMLAHPARLRGIPALGAIYAHGEMWWESQL